MSSGLSSSQSLSLPDSQIVTGNTAHTRPENRAFYPALDGFRAIAFLIVFLDHYYQIPWGWTGVNIFFVLSGFLITGILDDARDAPHRARNFYVRRTLRIFPLYYGIFFLILLTQPWMHWEWTRAWLAWPLYLGNFLRQVSPAAGIDGTTLQAAANGWLRTPNVHFNTIYLGHFWSLCVEEQFYLVWPWIVFWIRSRRTLLWFCASVVVLDAVLRVIVARAAPPWRIHLDLLHSFTPFALGSLLLGAVLALLWRGSYRRQLVLVSRLVASAAAVVAVVYLACTVHPSQPHWGANYVYPAWLQTVGIPFANLFSAALLICILEPKGLLFRFLSLSPLRWLGRVSYGAYVFHDIFHLTYDRIFRFLSAAAVRHLGPRCSILQRHSENLSPLFAFVCTLLLAWLSFRFFESPFLNLKERWTLRAGDRRATPSSRAPHIALEG